MTFQELSHQTKGKRMPNYYKTLLIHSETIIREVGLTNKHTVADLLNLNPTQFSLIYPCILAHVEIINEQVN